MKPNRKGYFLYNFDRSIASLVWGTSQETISSQVGRISRNEPQIGIPIKSKLGLWLCRKISTWLDEDTKLWGVNHTANAIQHATELDGVDDGHEQ